MTKPVPASPRRLACPRCGTQFDCALSGNCWCAAEPYRLSMTKTSEECMCPACLGKAAADLAEKRHVADDTH